VWVDTIDGEDLELAQRYMERFKKGKVVVMTSII
jgi:hypothetical protein